MTTPSTRANRPNRPNRSSRPRGSEVLRGKAAQKKAARRRNLILLAAASVVVLVAAIVIFVVALIGNNAPSITGSPAFVSADNTKYTAGKPVNGIGCGPTEQLQEHIHAHLDVYVDGKLMTAPAYVGFELPHNCLYWLHTHQSDGVIHIEAPQNTAVALGTFLNIWSVTPDSAYGQPIDHSLLHTLLTRRPDVVAVNGQPYTGDIRAIPLQYHTMITIGYGTHTVKQQPYDFSLVDGTSSGAM